MFLTRFLLVASLCIAAPLTALAAADETDQCVAGAAWKGGTSGLDGKAAGVYIDGTNNGMYADYIVYFKNAESKIKDGCENDVNTMVSAIKEIQDNLRGILMFAAADGTGDPDDNRNYSRERLNTVEQKLKGGRVDANLLGCEAADGTDPTDVCGKFYLGDAPWDDEDSHFERRAVYIFLIYNENVAAAVDICGDTFRNAQSGVTTILNGYGESAATAKEKWEAVTVFCSAKKERASQEDITQFESKMAEFLKSLPTKDNIRAAIENELSEVTLQLKIAQANLEYTRLTTGQASVWKTAEGEFNYHRLIADLSAGVVLGTGGGLLSSHLIKKAQVKEGFEDLQCTIGGQLVGNWGDQFLPTMTVAP